MENCFIAAGVNGAFISNSFNNDHGDMTLAKNTFSALTGTGVIYYGGGGLRFINNKMTGTFAHGLELFLGGDGNFSNSSDLNVTGNSIESTTASSVGVYLHRTGTGQFFNVVLNGNQFLTNTGIFVPTDATGNWITNMTVTGTTWLSLGNPGGAMYSIDSVNGLNITGGSASSGGSANVIYNFGATVSGKFSPPAQTGTFGASTGNAPSMTIADQSGVTFANLPATAADGSQIFITNGTAASSPCTGTGTGATAFRQAGAWRCF